MTRSWKIFLRRKVFVKVLQLLEPCSRTSRLWNFDLDRTDLGVENFSRSKSFVKALQPSWSRVPGPRNFGTSDLRTSEIRTSELENFLRRNCLKKFCKVRAVCISNFGTSDLELWNSDLRTLNWTSELENFLEAKVFVKVLKSWLLQDPRNFEPPIFGLELGPRSW